MSDRYRITGATTAHGTAPADDVRLCRPVELASLAVAPGAGQTTAAVLARLVAVRHPTVATVLDAELGPDRVLVVWPAAIGRPLGRGGEPATVVLDALAQAADSLDHAHQLGLDHGSLDASAVELRPGTRATVARLRRLGLASLAAAAAGRRDPASPGRDRTALVALARAALLPAAADTSRRLARLGHPVERADSDARGAELAALLDSAAVRLAAGQSCNAVVATLRQLLRL